jgi:hypothetical protein
MPVGKVGDMLGWGVGGVWVAGEDFVEATSHTNNANNEA